MRTIEWLPSKNFRNPLPFTAALWARLAESCVMTVFITLALIASCLLNESAQRADDLNENISPTTVDDANLTESLEEWRRQFNMICMFTEQINRVFGIVLLLQTALAFSSPIFEFNEILLSKGKFPRFYFEFFHAIFRFFLHILLPSYLVKQQV